MTQLEIEAFLTVIKYGSITRASESLFVSQPALSRRIKALETELGYGLIVRQKGVRSIELTRAGRAFIPIAEKWQLLWQESQSLRRADSKALFTVASVDSVSMYIMSAVYQAFLQSESETQLAVRTFHPRVFLDKMFLMEQFIQVKPCWAIVPPPWQTSCGTTRRLKSAILRMVPPTALFIIC